MKKYIVSVLTAVFGLFLSVVPVMAHVTVKPGEVGVGQRLNFVVSVPTEEVDPTVKVRLVIPEGVTSVRPNTKTGWEIQLVKTGEGETERVSEIIWSGGKIPAEQRDEFIFSAIAPTETTTMVWKAYQTYADGDVVAWENSPEVIAEYTKNNPPKESVVGMADDHNAPRPYSTTQVINDLKSVDKSETTKPQEKGSNTLNYIAIGLSILALGMHFKKRD